MKLVGAMVLLFVVGCGKDTEAQMRAAGSAVQMIDEAEHARARSDEAEKKRHEAEAAAEKANAEAAAAENQVQELQKETDTMTADINAAVDAVTKAQSDADRDKAKAMLASLQKKQRELEQRIAASRTGGKSSGSAP